MTISRPPLPPLQMHVHPPVPLVSGLRCEQEQDRSRAFSGAVRLRSMRASQAAPQRDRLASATMPAIPVRAVRASRIDAAKHSNVSTCAHDANSGAGLRAGRQTGSGALIGMTFRALSPAPSGSVPTSACSMPGGERRPAHVAPGDLTLASLRERVPLGARAASWIATVSGGGSASGSDRSGEEVA
jgi:hypothetical protein